MNILVTGGSGFIGSHLTEFLLEQGHEVWVIDDLSTGSAENLAAARNNPRLHCFWDTIFHRQILAELVDMSDAIVHLAAAVGVRLVMESPVRTIETNVRGTQQVLELASKGRKKVLLASTSEVYGKSAKVPFREDDDLVLGATWKGRWSYACSKALDEFLALAYWREKKLPVVVARFFNTVGPRQTGRYGMVLPTFVSQALANRPITVFGNGKQIRCFCHVRDVVRAVTELLFSDATVGEVYNVGSDQRVTIGDLAAIVKERASSESEIHSMSYQEAYGEGFEDMQVRVPSLEKIQAAIGYQPTRSLPAIIDDVIEGLRERNVTTARTA